MTATATPAKPVKTLEETALDLERARRRARKIVDAESQAQIPPLVCLTVGELYQHPQTDYLIDEFLPEKSLAELIGDSESLKSFFAIHLALSIATNQPQFFGLPVVRHGAVVYIAAEGASSFQFRLRAWAHEHKVDLLQAPFHVVPVPVNLRDEKFQQSFCELLGRVRPVLVVVDTLHRCAPGAEENNSRDIGEVVAFAQKLQYDYSTAVLFLHHPPKSDPRGRGRGSSALYYAADTEISAVVKGEENPDGTKFVEFAVRKQKDDAKVSFCLTNRIVSIYNELGGEMCYRSGRAIKSCVLDLATDEQQAEANRRDEKRQTPKGNYEQKVLTYVDRHPASSRTAVAKNVEGKEAYVQKAIDRLLREGALASRPKGNGWVLEVVEPRESGADAGM